jgi:hypothetical protein
MEQRKSKPFFKMTAQEKDAFVRRLENGIPRSKLRPLSPRDNLLWEAAKRGRGRPRTPPNQKSVAVQVTFKPQLLAAIDEYARKRGITRAQLLAEGAKLALMRKSA